MFRISRVFDSRLRVDRLRLEQVQAIVRKQLPEVPERKIAAIPDQVDRPLEHGFRTILFVAEGDRHRVRGFALVSHAPRLRFFFLDYLCTAPGRTGSGVGGALYERVREEARHLDVAGIFFECLPDDPELCSDAELRKENRARLRFYERYGARPVVGTIYEQPMSPDQDCSPYLMLDGLGDGGTVERRRAREIVRAILERKYGDLCSPEYVARVVESIQDPELRLREPHYVDEDAAAEAAEPAAVEGGWPADRRVALVVNDRHEIHHVRERGYVEAPARVRKILAAIEGDGAERFERLEPRRFPDREIVAVHDPEYVTYFRRVCEGLDPDASVYPYVFPIRNPERRPVDLPTRAGYYCIDTFTPLSQNAWKAARRGVDCTLTAAERLLEGDRLAYALVRPPGHHAERRSFGGFCYFNNAAIAANRLSREGKVAILDVDYHHGNGQQDIFYDRDDVLTVSIHCHPRTTYPYFTGYEDERGEAAGEGFNLNVALPESVDGERYLRELRRVLKAVREFDPAFLVVALGLDPAKGDPTGSWSLTAPDFERNGAEIGALGLPTLVVQEGGYRVRDLGRNVLGFFRGLASGAFA